MKALYSLSEVERRLIVTWNLSADISLREIAQRADIREHRIRHALENLVRNGIITPSYLIDNYRLGFADYGIFFSPSVESSVRRSRFEETLMAHPRVYWLARLSGAFQYGMTFLAQQPYELLDFCSATQAQSQGAYPVKTLRVGVDCTWFSPNYLAPYISHREKVHITSRETCTDLEPVDRGILIGMTRNPASSTAQLARALGMSASSLAYRLDKLRDQKIVRGRMYSIRTSLLGILTYRVMVIDCGLSLQQRQRFFDMCEACQHVVAILTCSGSWDFEIRFETQDPDTLESFCQQLVDSFGESIGSVMVSQQISTLKRIAYPDEEPRFAKTAN